MEQLSLAGLVSAVEELPAREVMRCPQVQSLRRGARVSGVELGRYCFVRPGSYTRNLIFRSSELELMVLWWDAGAVSPIHDHGGQQCVLSVQQGELEQREYLRTPEGVKPLGLRWLRPGNVDLRTEDRVVHQIRAHAPAASLHLYVRPVDACLTFSLAERRPLLRNLRYDSMFGRAVRLGLVPPPEPQVETRWR